MRTLATVLTGLVVVLAACGGPSVEPIGEGPTAGDDTSAGGPVDGCRPALGPDDPHPLDQSTGQHEAFAGEDWVGPLAQAVNTEHADVLGGLWLDNAAGEVVVMVPGTEGREAFEELRQEAAHPDRVVCMEAEYTAAELEELQRQVFDRIGASETNASGGTDTIRNHVSVAVEGDLEAVEEELGELADHPALELHVPDCAEVVPPPEGAMPLPGGASNCSSMEALYTGTLAGDPASGCAWFEDPEGQPITVVWPRGWSITEDGTVLDHRGEPRAAIGDDIESGGGNVPLEEGQRACGLGGEDGAWVVGSLTTASAADGEPTGQ